MRRSITFFLLIISVFVMYGAALCDSTKVYFALNKATIIPTHDSNAESMVEFIDGVVAAAHSGHIDHIDVYAYASPEGPFLNNNRLSVERCNVVADYISRHVNVPLKDIHTYPGGVAWEGLRTLVIENPHTPYRSAVLRILDEYIPDACTNRDMSDICRVSLMSIDNGHTYRWMLENLFPRLRYSLVIYTYTTADSPIDHPVRKNTGIAPGLISAAAMAAPLPSSIDDITPMPLQPLHRLAIKTNLLYDAALLPNIEVEYLAGKHWSVAIEGGVAWWGKYSKERSYRLAMVSPEVKYWIRPRAPWHGLYAGAFAGGTLYDLEKGSPGYRGEGAFGGISLGYMWPVSRCLSLEAAVGAGYLFTRYKEYIPLEGHHVYQRTKDLHYFGPLKVKLSLVWRLWDQNKSVRRKPKGDAI